MKIYKVAFLLIIILGISGCGKISSNETVSDAKIKSIEKYRNNANNTCAKAAFSTALSELTNDQFKLLNDSLTKQKAPKELELVHNQLIKELKGADNKSIIAIVSKYAEKLHRDKCLRSSKVNIPEAPQNPSPSTPPPSSGSGGGGGGGNKGSIPPGGGIDDDSPTLINGFTVTKDRDVWRSYFKRINSSCTSLRMAKEALIQDLTTISGGAIVNGSSLSVLYSDAYDMTNTLETLQFDIDSDYGQSPPDTFESSKSNAISEIKKIKKIIDASILTIESESNKPSPDSTKMIVSANKALAELQTLQPVLATLGLTGCP